MLLNPVLIMLSNCRTQFSILKNSLEEPQNTVKMQYSHNCQSLYLQLSFSRLNDPLFTQQEKTGNFTSGKTKKQTQGELSFLNLKALYGGTTCTSYFTQGHKRLLFKAKQITTSALTGRGGTELVSIKMFSKSRHGAGS